MTETKSEWKTSKVGPLARIRETVSRRAMTVVQITLSLAAFVAFSFAWLFYLTIEDNGRYFLLCILLATLGVALVLLAWVILVHGDLKQRTDGCVAVFTSIVLLAMALVALRMYNNDSIISADCLERPAAAVCGDKIAMAQHDQNAATLEQIWSLMAFGQIVPLLSVLKDTLYCWLKPTPWRETSHPWADNRRVRRENRFRVAETDTPVEP